MVCECGTDLTFDDAGECPVCGLVYENLDCVSPPERTDLFDDPELDDEGILDAGDDDFDSDLSEK